MYNLHFNLNEYSIFHTIPTWVQYQALTKAVHLICKIVTRQARWSYHSTSQPNIISNIWITICQLVYPRSVPTFFILWGCTGTSVEWSHLARKGSLNFIIHLFCGYCSARSYISSESYCNNFYKPAGEMHLLQYSC